jgi:hypothetical protein
LRLIFLYHGGGFLRQGQVHAQFFQSGFGGRCAVQFHQCGFFLGMMNAQLVNGGLVVSGFGECFVHLQTQEDGHPHQQEQVHDVHVIFVGADTKQEFAVP